MIDSKPEPYYYVDCGGGYGTEITLTEFVQDLKYNPSEWFDGLQMLLDAVEDAWRSG